MKIFKDKVIFNMSNPNFIIKNTIDEVANMIKNIPVVLVNKKNGVPTNNIIGVIEKYTKVKDDLIYGDITIYDDRLKIGEIVNYEVATTQMDSDRNALILNVNCIAVNLKEE